MTTAKKPALDQDIFKLLRTEFDNARMRLDRAMQATSANEAISALQGLDITLRNCLAYHQTLIALHVARNERAVFDSLLGHRDNDKDEL